MNNYNYVYIYIYIYIYIHTRTNEQIATSSNTAKTAKPRLDDKSTLQHNQTDKTKTTKLRLDEVSAARCLGRRVGRPPLGGALQLIFFEFKL